MKSLVFIGSSLKELKGFPEDVRRETGFQLYAIQCGLEPADWKSLTSIGPGVKEIRIRLGGSWRIIYLATSESVVYVLHAFQKKSQKIPRRNIRIMQKRYVEIGKMV